MKSWFFKKKRGFTLIELLVVISIISLLSSLVLASLNTVRSKARDAKRQADMLSIRNALELYYLTNGSYPSTGGGWVSGDPSCTTYNPGGNTYTTSGATGYISNLAPQYISVLPVDPKPIPPSYCYLYRSTGTDYMFLVYATVEGTVPNSLKRPIGVGEQDYAVYSPGAAGF